MKFLKKLWAAVMAWIDDTPVEPSNPQQTVAHEEPDGFENWP